MPKKNSNKFILDKEEQWFEDHLGEFVPISGKEKKRLDTALTKVRKEKNISLRMREIDINRLKKEAISEGLPYQTLISSILYKYTTGQLIDIKKAKKILSL